MVSIEQVRQLAENHPERRFMVHNGYHVWSYGAPRDPVWIRLETACYLINRVGSASEERSLLDGAMQLVPPLQYAEEGNDLYHRTGGNRFIQFLEPSSCVIEREHKVENPSSFDLGD